METHEALSAIAFPGRFVRVGERIPYSGKPVWNLRPLDPEEREKWEKETADPEKVTENRRRNTIPGYFPEEW